MSEPVPSFSLVVGDPLYRVQRALRLVSSERLAIGRRALLYALLAWLPMAVWAVVTSGRGVFEGSESFLRHFDVQARCLLAIPMLVMAERFTETILGLVVPHFVRSGIVAEKQHAAFATAIHRTERTRNSPVGWLLIFGLTAWSVAQGVAQGGELHAVSWATTGGELGFGGWWYLVVARPLTTVLLLSWLWRVAVLTVLFYRISRLDLQLAPAHPDRAAGLGFLEVVPGSFSLVVLAISTVLSAHAAHEVLVHGVALASLKVQAVGTLVVLLAVFLAPLAAFTKKLRATRRRAYLEYGGLAARTGGAFDTRWIDKGEGNIFDSSDMSTMCDTGVVYQAATTIRMLPIRKMTLFAILTPAAIPMLCVVTTQIPIAQILKALAGALV